MVPQAKKPAGVDVLGDLVKGTRRLIERLRDDVDEFSMKGRMKLEILSLKNKRAHAFRELGMRVFVLARKGVDLPAGLKPLVGEIGRLDTAIVEQDEALRKLEMETGATDRRRPAGMEVTQTRVRRRSGKRKTAVPETVPGDAPDEVVDSEDVGL